MLNATHSLIKGSVAVVLLIAVALPVRAADAARVLIPVSAYNLPGAYGSVWTTELRCFNPGEQPVTITPVTQSHYQVTPGWIELVPTGWAPPDRPGVVLAVLGEGADRVQFDLRLFNTADPATTWGTNVPVVREHEFATSVDLINVPTATDLRTALRIYTLDPAAPDESARISVYSDDGQFLGETEIPFRFVRPSYAALSIVDVFPQIRQEPRVRVHVTSRSGTAKLWAFVSVTSNATQHVSLVTPD